MQLMCPKVERRFETMGYVLRENLSQSEQSAVLDDRDAEAVLPERCVSLVRSPKANELSFVSVRAVSASCGMRACCHLAICAKR